MKNFQIVVLVGIAGLLIFISARLNKMIRTQEVQARQEILNGWVSLNGVVGHDCLHRISEGNIERGGLSCQERWTIIQMTERFILLKSAYDAKVISNSEWEAVVRDGQDLFHLTQFLETWKLIRGSYSAEQQAFIEKVLINPTQ